MSFLFVFFLFTSTIQTNGLQKDLGIEIGDQIEYNQWEDETSYFKGNQIYNYYEELGSTYEVNEIDTVQDLIYFDVLIDESKQSYQTSESLDHWGSKAIYVDFEYWRVQLESIVKTVNETQINYFDILDNGCDFGYIMAWDEPVNISNQTISYKLNTVQIYSRIGILSFIQNSRYTDYNNGTEIYQYWGFRNTSPNCEYTEEVTELVGPPLTPLPENAPFPGKSTTPTLSAKLPGFEMYFVFSLGLIILVQRRSINESV